MVLLSDFFDTRLGRQVKSRVSSQQRSLIEDQQSVKKSNSGSKKSSSGSRVVSKSNVPSNDSSMNSSFAGPVRPLPGESKPEYVERIKQPIQQSVSSSPVQHKGEPRVMSENWQDFQSRYDTGGISSVPVKVSQSGSNDLIMVNPSMIEPSHTMSRDEYIDYLSGRYSTVKERHSESLSSYDELSEAYENVRPGRIYFVSDSGMPGGMRPVSGQLLKSQLGRARKETVKVSNVLAGIEGNIGADILSVERMPKDTTFVVKESGNVDVKIPDQSLGWAEGEMSKIQSAYKVNPVLGFTAELGFGIISSTASLGKPVAQWVSGKPLPHYPSPWDYVFEPIGWSPKGSTDFLRSHRVFTAGGMISEVGQAWVIGYTAGGIKSGILSGSRYIVKKAPDVMSKFSKVFPEEKILSGFGKKLTGTTVAGNVGRWGSGKYVSGLGKYSPVNFFRRVYWGGRKTSGSAIQFPENVVWNEDVLKGIKKFASAPGAGTQYDIFQGTRMFSSSDNILSIHAAPHRFHRLTILKKGTSESPGLSVSAFGEGSPHFLKTGGYMSSQSDLSISLFPRFHAPTAPIISLDDIYRLPTGIRKSGYDVTSSYMLSQSPGRYGWIAPKSEIGGPEIESIIRSGTWMSRTGSRYFTTYKGMIVPLPEYSVLQSYVPDFVSKSSVGNISGFTVKASQSVKGFIGFSSYGLKSRNIAIFNPSYIIGKGFSSSVSSGLSSSSKGFKNVSVPSYPSSFKSSIGSVGSIFSSKGSYISGSVGSIGSVSSVGSSLSSSGYVSSILSSGSSISSVSSIKGIGSSFGSSGSSSGYVKPVDPFDYNIPFLYSGSRKIKGKRKSKSVDERYRFREFKLGSLGKLLGV